MTHQMRSSSLGQTEELAAGVGTKLRGGEVLVLISDLGGGKTAFVRGLARGMGSYAHVSSPTFTISREYQAAGRHLTLYHFDFYRLAEPGLIANELAEVIDDPRAVIAVEWGAIVADVLPDEKLIITIIRTGDSSRELSFAYPSSLKYLIPERAA